MINYIEAKTDNTYYLTKYPIKFMEIFNEWLSAEIIILTNRSWYPRLSMSTKRGLPSYKELWQSIHAEILKIPYFEENQPIWFFPWTEVNSSQYHNIILNLMIKKDILKFKPGLIYTDLVIQNDYTEYELYTMGLCNPNGTIRGFPPNNFQEQGWDIGQTDDIENHTYNDYMNSLIGVQGISNIIHDNPLSNADMFINLIDNLEINEEDLKLILKYLIEKL